MNQMSPIEKAAGEKPAAISLVLEVTGRRSVGEGIEEFTFASADGAPLPAWQPGAHVEFLLPLAGRTEGRSYSLLGNYSDRQHWRIAVQLQPEGQGGSVWMHKNAVLGAMVPAIGPRQAFTFLKAERYLFIAGGIGITPLLPMIAAVSARGKSWELVYLARSESRFVYAEQLRAYPGGKVQFYASAEPNFDLAAKLESLLAGTAVQACGPAPMLDALEKLAATANGSWSLSIERFTPPELGNGERTFELKLARSNKVLMVSANRSILEVLRAEGIKIDSTCRSGSCGTCECGVLEGRIDHRDQVLTPAERERGNTMMVCVSRAAGDRLVLDI
ncbi:PDR/VanB family oxidoreductase [Hyphomicrobium sp. 99]|uniref:PDR/VanB family oxidoreductase n=1 Tax=Hyphomicrobium sp. 99 TaxID=1163419 RepID=UPI0006969222|nr:PDR/VanB family oxidoreductase [Hyphomicrobium sp. 99]